NGSYFTGINPLKSSWDLYDNTASLTRLTVQADGNVGIGTTTPDSNYKLTTSGGGVKAENSSALQSAGYFSNAGGGPAITAGTGGMTLGGVNKTAWPSGGTSQWVDGTGGIIYYNGGNVGIGTSTPLAQLHLYSNTSNGLFIQNTGTGYAGVRVQTSNGSYFTGITIL
ncbi:hypothetical protein HYV91_01425, partial [Candidatus Wolfebacteria bacterium]|nr:hypothetical protein [Candidatus Wolfebacteria bacterium]